MLWLKILNLGLTFGRIYVQHKYYDLVILQNIVVSAWGSCNQVQIK